MLDHWVYRFDRGSESDFKTLGQTQCFCLTFDTTVCELSYFLTRRSLNQEQTLQSTTLTYSNALSYPRRSLTLVLFDMSHN